MNGDYSSQNCVGVSDRNVMGVMARIGWEHKGETPTLCLLLGGRFSIRE